MASSQERKHDGLTSIHLDIIRRRVRREQWLFTMYQTAYMNVFRSIPLSHVTHHRWGRKHESDRLVISPQQRPVRLVELHTVRARRTLAHV